MMSALHRVYRSNEEWLSHTGRIFATWAIFNPNGPTIMSVGATDCGDPNVKTLFFRWVNPFKQASYGLGRIDVAITGWAKHLSLILSRAANTEAKDFRDDWALFTCIPSMVALSGDETIDQVCKDMFRAGLRQGEFDWGRELAFRRRYGSNLF